MSRVVLENIHVRYPVFQDYYQSICRALLRAGSAGRLYNESASASEIHALKDISFELRDGDRVALIGDNGAGKSTLLRTIGGFITPAAGTLRMSGKVTSLFNPDGGMDMDQTGYDNMFIIGRLHGIRRPAMAQHIPDIETFSGLGEFLKMPVRSYSDGMKVRLGIAIMTCLHPDILILDEVIGAGDVHFIIKATERLQSMYDRASIIIMASHSPDILTKLCRSAIWLDRGRIVKIGEVNAILEEYTNARPYPAGDR